jgi:tRNA (guanine37-N1)-methyltransferase
VRIDILSVVPELLVSPLGESILKRAQAKGLVEIVVHNIRDYTTDKHRQVDDYPFGGEAGMVMKPEPVARLIDRLRGERDYDEIIYTSPDGVRHDQHEANRLSTLDNIMILCGHYKGLDQRIRDHYITREISIGDYVLTGGELAAAVITDSVVRIIPGAIGDGESALTDSFQDDMLAPPVYTRPAEWRGMRVPDVLLSGNPVLIRDWQEQQALERTQRLRPDLITNYELRITSEKNNTYSPEGCSSKSPLFKKCKT